MCDLISRWRGEYFSSATLVLEERWRKRSAATEGSECAFYKLLGAILRLFSRLSKFFIALLSRKRAAKRRHRDSRFKQSFAFRSLCFRRCCLYAAKSGTEQLAVRVYRATLLPLRSNKLRSFSSFAANNNSRSYSAVFRRLLPQ